MFERLQSTLMARFNRSLMVQAIDPVNKGYLRYDYQLLTSMMGDMPALTVAPPDGISPQQVGAAEVWKSLSTILRSIPCKNHDETKRLSRLDGYVSHMQDSIAGSHRKYYVDILEYMVVDLLKKKDDMHWAAALCRENGCGVNGPSTPFVRGGGNLISIFDRSPDLTLKAAGRRTAPLISAVADNLHMLGTLVPAQAAVPNAKSQPAPVKGTAPWTTGRRPF